MRKRMGALVPAKHQALAPTSPGASETPKHEVTHGDRAVQHPAPLYFCFLRRNRLVWGVWESPAQGTGIPEPSEGKLCYSKAERSTATENEGRTGKSGERRGKTRGIAFYGAAKQPLG